MHRHDPPHDRLRRLSLTVLFCSALGACGGGSDAAASGALAAAPTAPTTQAPAPADASPAAGHSGGHCAIPAAAQAVALAAPDHVVGNGTAASCSSDAVVAAVAQGGTIGFDCGADPVTITMTRTAKVFNDKPNVVLDGGGKRSEERRVGKECRL